MAGAVGGGREGLWIGRGWEGLKDRTRLTWRGRAEVCDRSTCWAITSPSGPTKQNSSRDESNPFVKIENEIKFKFKYYNFKFNLDLVGVRQTLPIVQRLGDAHDPSGKPLWWALPKKNKFNIKMDT